ncbi:MAG: hypothetical protein ACYCZQ_00090 [Burkholderiales bacterium]
MSSTGYRQSRDLAAFPRWRIAGFSARGLARISLVSWLFTLAVCFYGDLTQTPAHQAQGAALAHEHTGYSEHDDDGTQHADDCCTVLQNLPAFSKAGNIPISLQHLMYVLPAFLLVLHAVLLTPARTRFFSTDPPGKAGHGLIANSLWPNAPPR